MFFSFYLEPEREKKQEIEKQDVQMERRWKAYRRGLLVTLWVSLLFFCSFSVYYIRRMIPEELKLIRGQESRILMQLPIKARIVSDSKEVTLKTESSIPSGEVHVLLSNGFSLYSDSLGEYRLGVDLFGYFHISDVEVQVIDQELVYPNGMPIGIYLKTDGILIVGTATITDMEGNRQEPAYGIVRSGDYITAIDQVSVTSKEDVAALLALAGQRRSAVLTIRRNQEEIQVRVPVLQAEDGTYKAGIWIRDDTQGIGTLTYIRGDGRFGALGHGISDPDTQTLVESGGGSLYRATIRAVVRGTMGAPGSLSGVIRYSKNDFLGNIEKNTDNGIFGELTEKTINQMELGEGMEVAMSQEIKEGEATMLCYVEGEVKEYTVRINRIDLGRKDNKSMVIEVTDPRLLRLCGGIVQGMSGAPILQNGKLVGAVTHVLVNDPTRGYGIFIENMLDTAG